MNLSDVPLEFAVATGAGLAASVVFAWLTRGTNRGRPNVEGSGLPHSEDHRPVVQTGVVTGSGNLNQQIGDRVSYVNTHRHLHVNGGGGAARSDSGDEMFLCLVTAGVLSVVIVVCFARWMGWILPVSVGMTVATCLIAIVLFLRTRNADADMRTAARKAAFEVVVLCGTTVAVWGLALSTERDGVTLRTIEGTAMEMRSAPNWWQRWFPIGHVIDVYTVWELMPFAFIAAGIAIVFLMFAWVSLRHLDWVMALLARRPGCTPTGFGASRARAFEAMGWSSRILMTVVPASFAVVLASGILTGMWDISVVPSQPDPVPIPTPPG